MINAHAKRCCDWCHALIPDPEEKGQEDICVSCFRVRKILGNESAPKPKTQASPMAVDSRGLHEKYFHDTK